MKKARAITCVLLDIGGVLLTPFAKVRGTAITYPAEASGSAPKRLSAKRSRPQPVAKTPPK